MGLKIDPKIFRSQEDFIANSSDFIAAIVFGVISEKIKTIIVNIIDSFTKVVNAQYDAPDFEYEDWDIHASWYDRGI